VLTNLPKAGGSLVFGKHPLYKDGGVNPPYAPSYPMNWDAAHFRVDIVAQVDDSYLDEILSYLPFEKVTNRVLFRYLDAKHHTLATHTDGFNETLVALPIRYKDRLSWTYIFHYTSDEIANIAGREMLGYSKKDANTELHFDQPRKWGKTMRRGTMLTKFEFVPDAKAPVVPVMANGEEPDGAIHVRRFPYPDRPETAYADVIFRRYQLKLTEVVPGNATLQLFDSEWDPLAKLKPKVLAASYNVGDFGGPKESEERAILDVLVLPDLVKQREFA
jgi:acetoacetate decarboxylase